MLKKGRRYSNRFKSNAIRLLIEEGKSVNSLAKELGINGQTLRNWINNYKKKQHFEILKINELKRELREKQKRIDDLEESVDILKKASILFAQDNHIYEKR